MAQRQSPALCHSGCVCRHHTATEVCECLCSLRRSERPGPTRLPRSARRKLTRPRCQPWGLHLHQRQRQPPRLRLRRAPDFQLSSLQHRMHSPAGPAVMARFLGRRRSPMQPARCRLQDTARCRLRRVALPHCSRRCSRSSPPGSRFSQPTTRLVTLTDHSSTLRLAPGQARLPQLHLRPLSTRARPLSGHLRPLSRRLHPCIRAPCPGWYPARAAFPSGRPAKQLWTGRL